MRSPRSSFHHLVVTRPGSRRSSSRPNAIAAWRTSVNVHRGGEVGARLWVKVDAQLVRVVDIVAANRPGVKRDRSHLGRPADNGHLRGTDLIRMATGRELDPRGLHVVRSPPRDALLV